MLHAPFLMLPSILLVDMAFEARRRAAAAVVVSVAAWFFMWYPYFKVGFHNLSYIGLIHYKFSVNVHLHLCFVDLGLHRSN